MPNRITATIIQRRFFMGQASGRFVFQASFQARETSLQYRQLCFGVATSPKIPLRFHPGAIQISPMHDPSDRAQIEQSSKNEAHPEGALTSDTLVQSHPTRWPPVVVIRYARSPIVLRPKRWPMYRVIPPAQTERRK